MLKEDSHLLTGDERYEGFNVDLVKEISKILGCKYTIKLVEDGKYGNYDKKTGTWSGMIGELHSQKADLVVADITITSEREKVVDFTIPFMNLGITILYKKPTKKAPNLFAFLSPLSLDVWIYVITAFIAVSLLLFIISHFTAPHFSPCEKSLLKTGGGTNYDEAGPGLARQDPLHEAIFTGTGNPVRSIGTQANVDSGDTSHSFTIMNSFWFILATFFRQKVDIEPSSFSTRMVAALWWFFTLIMIASYTANLAAFLTLERMENPIESADDLARQNKIKYGAVYGGSTMAFFKDSEIDIYQRIWRNMDQNRNAFTKTYMEGVDRVLKEDGGYAFFMESTKVDYIVERMCELTQVGGLLDNKSYGIGLPPTSPYRAPINNAILQLQEGGILRQLKYKWWTIYGEGACAWENSGSCLSALSLQNLGGIFLVLIVGLGMACVTAVVECVWTRKSHNQDHRLCCHKKN